MKNAVLLLASAALAVLLFGGAAIAADIACPNPGPGEPANFCTGTNGRDTLTGTAGADQMFGSDGNDTVNGLGGPDRMFGGDGDGVFAGEAGNDTMNGGRGADIMFGEDGNDLMRGGAGEDAVRGVGGKDRIMVADGRRDRANCGLGRDVVEFDRGLDKTEDCEIRRPR